MVKEFIWTKFSKILVLYHVIFTTGQVSKNIIQLLHETRNEGVRLQLSLEVGFQSFKTLAVTK